MQSNIITVKYEDKFNPNTFCGKAYTYYSNIDVQVGDLVIAPTASGDKIARVSKIDIPENEIEKIKPYLKTIEQKIDKEKYLQYRNMFRKVA